MNSADLVEYCIALSCPSILHILHCNEVLLVDGVFDVRFLVEVGATNFCRMSVLISLVEREVKVLSLIILATMLSDSIFDKFASGITIAFLPVHNNVQKCKTI